MSQLAHYTYIVFSVKRNIQDLYSYYLWSLHHLIILYSFVLDSLESGISFINKPLLKLSMSLAFRKQVFPANLLMSLTHLRRGLPKVH